MNECSWMGAALVISLAAGQAFAATLEAPRQVFRYDLAEFTIRADPMQTNPFTEAEILATFEAPGVAPVKVDGFCDSQDGTIFRLRFCPNRAGVTYAYEIRLKRAEGEQVFTGKLECHASDNRGPVIVDKEHPKHFTYAGSGEPFYHLGFTAYHLFDPTNDDAQIRETVDYCKRNGFNKIRFLLAGYPRDTDTRMRDGFRSGKPGDWNEPNYGAPPGEVNALPAWEGEAHTYDFTRFNLEHWQRIDRAVAYMRERGIIATCIVTIEKQGLPDEYGRLTEHELRLYRYAIARLAAFDNVWWDLGNEHNEYRDRAWGDIMGAFVKEHDPYDRLVSAHAHADFFYSDSDWADFIITQQYGTEREVNEWAQTYFPVQKPYVNEEYGYEGETDKPGHGQNADWVRRCHWAIALAGGYATYGDWHDGGFYTGEPSIGKAASQLRHLVELFESLPFREMAPRNDLVSSGSCLALADQTFLVYLPRGGALRIELPEATFAGVFINPRTGDRTDVGAPLRGPADLNAPDENDWALLLRTV